MNKKYTIGVDYGTLSGRAVLTDVSNGEIICQSIKDYTHAVMDKTLPDGTPLPFDWALQHPNDYLEVLQYTIPDILKKSGVSPSDIIGIGTDFTACTMLPVDKNGMPLCLDEKYKGRPHSWVKLWKHHAAQYEANRLNKTAEDMGEEFLSRYGGKISSEWMIAKIMQIVDEDKEIYDNTYTFMEAADWIIMMLTGNWVRNSCTAGYKAIWHKQKGYPSKKFFKALNPTLENLAKEKFNGTILPVGDKAGTLTKEAANKIGLLEGTAVAVGNVDAHVSLPAVGIDSSGKMLMIMGTSTCDILLGEEEKIVPGICGVAEDGVLPGFIGYESGQSCVGDHFGWFIDNCVPSSYYEAAKELGMNIHQYLSFLGEKLKPGESGLLALDWWNGNRSCLVDVDLTGMIMGMTLATKPEEIYRALIEATAFGKRIIIENFIEHGVPVDELYACGGLSKKNPFLMQIYADITGKDIYIGSSDQAPALGSSMFAAVAAGKNAGGYDTIFDAIKVMGKSEKKPYRPIPQHKEVYDKLYAEFKILHDYFGRGENDVMKRLKAIKKETAKGEVHHA